MVRGAKITVRGAEMVVREAKMMVRGAKMVTVVPTTQGGVGWEETLTKRGATVAKR